MWVFNSFVLGNFCFCFCFFVVFVLDVCLFVLFVLFFVCLLLLFVFVFLLGFFGELWGGVWFVVCFFVCLLLLLFFCCCCFVFVFGGGVFALVFYVKIGKCFQVALGLQPLNISEHTQTHNHTHRHTKSTMCMPIILITVSDVLLFLSESHLVHLSESRLQFS